MDEEKWTGSTDRSVCLCVVSLWVYVLRHQMHFHDFRPNCDELLEFRRKWCHSEERKILGNAICRCCLQIYTLSAPFYTVLCYILIVPSSDQFSHTPGLYGNTKQMQCVVENAVEIYFRPKCASLCMHRQAIAVLLVRITFETTKCLYMNYRSKRRNEDFNYFLNRTSKKQHLSMFGSE